MEGVFSSFALLRFFIAHPSLDPFNNVISDLVQKRTL